MRMTKKIIATIVVIGVFCFIGRIENSFHYYETTGKILHISSYGSVDFVDERTHNIFSFYGDGYEVGEMVKVKWFDNFTVTYTDDEVIDVEIIKEEL